MAVLHNQPLSLLEEQPRLPARGGSTKIRRFNGITRKTHDWDGLRKDAQLWFEDGDCLVHLYAYGTSQRGPSLKLPSKDIERLGSTYLMSECVHSDKSNDQVRRVDSKLDCTPGSSLPTIAETDVPRYELYVPSPTDASRDEVFNFHLNTRNLFAYAVGRPVVGERLSSALAGMLQRLQAWAPQAASSATITAYLETQGYANFAENPEHALACLKFAESAKIRDLWIDSFAHCAGMHERLFLSPEYPGVSNTTNALITRASLEMDLHIARVVRAVSAFLEEELGAEHLGLSKPARDHLDHFRSCLHSFYVDKLGYFPPRERTPWNKRPWKAMHHDFRCLYNYLVDSESTCDMSSAKALTGGICVTQNVQAFDQRHGYDALPHPLPLLPGQPAPPRRKSPQKGLRSLALVSGLTPTADRRPTAGQCLAMATNCLDDEVMACSLVHEYQRFERQKLAVKLDPAEARKVRWILIYSVLQMLTSIMKAPKEVRAPQKTSYPLCILTGGCPPWSEDDELLVPISAPAEAATTLVPEAMDALEGRTSRISIHPDCEADNAEDFFASLSGPRSDTFASPSLVPAPLRVSSQLGRHGSIRSSMHSSVQALHRSVTGSLGRRNSVRAERSRMKEPRKTRSYCEIVVEDYGNGLYPVYPAHQPSLPWPTAQFEHDLASPSAPLHNQFQDFDFGLDDVPAEPVLESQQLSDQDQQDVDEPDLVVGEPDFVVDEPDFVIGAPYDPDTSVRDSYFSTGSGYPASSNRSSLQNSETPDTDLSSCDNYNRETESDTSAPGTPMESTYVWRALATAKPARYRRPFSMVTTKVNSVNVGCYVPSGMYPPTTSKSSHRRVKSSHSAKSNASSFYPEESVQAADIDEEECRGRRKSRDSRGYDRDAVKFVL